MANVRNYEEYRAEVLDRLGDDYTVEDLRNTERWRLRVLDMLSGGGSGGGGESDFSTAEVTFENVDITTRPYQAIVTSVESDSIKSVDGEVSSPFTVTVPLYKGKNILPVSCIHFNDESYMPTTEGSVEFSIESMGFVVTGDGTIKAKGLSGAN